MKFEKPKRAIDYLPKKPLKAMQEIWDGPELADVLEELEKWFFDALKSTSCIYDENYERRAFILFYFELRVFIEATFFYTIPKDKDRKKRYKKASPDMRVLMDEQLDAHNLTEDQKLNPMPLMEKFCKSFSPLYVRIELWDLFEAVSEVSMCDSDFYLNLLTLAEAAYVITKEK